MSVLIAHPSFFASLRIWALSARVSRRRRTADFGQCRWIGATGEGLLAVPDVVMIEAMQLGSPATPIQPRDSPLARCCISGRSRVVVVAQEKLRVARDFGFLDPGKDPRSDSDERGFSRPRRRREKPARERV